MSEKIYVYKGNAVQISFDSKRCIHAEECVHGLPGVFDPKAKPWVNPDGADATAVAEVIMRCPTGALHFQRLDGGQNEPVPAQNTITIAADGPLYLRGQIEVADAAGTTLLEDTRVALCRCGASSNKPFCDGSHTGTNFQDDGTVQIAPAESDEAPLDSKLRVVCTTSGPFLIKGPAEVMDAFGEPACGAYGVALCRCGASNNKPFCDGNHKQVGFVCD